MMLHITVQYQLLCKTVLTGMVTVLPLYGGISPRLMRGLRSCVCRMSFTRSMGATAVFAMAPAMPPASRSLKNSLVTLLGAATAPLLMSLSFAEEMTMLGLTSSPLSGATCVERALCYAASTCLQIWSIHPVLQ